MVKEKDTVGHERAPQSNSSPLNPSQAQNALNVEQNNSIGLGITVCNFYAFVYTSINMWLSIY